MFGEAWTGVSSDLQRATEMAEAMVKEYGMSEVLGLVAHKEDRRAEYLGMPGSDRDYSEDTARKIDNEVARIVDEGYAKAREILSANRTALDRVVEVLLETEVMEGEELRELLGLAEPEAPLSRARGSDDGNTAPEDGVPEPSPAARPAQEGT